MSEDRADYAGKQPPMTQEERIKYLERLIVAADDYLQQEGRCPACGSLNDKHPDWCDVAEIEKESRRIESR